MFWLFTVGINCPRSQNFCKFLTFSLEFQKTFSISRTIFSHSVQNNFGNKLPFFVGRQSIFYFRLEHLFLFCLKNICMYMKTRSKIINNPTSIQKKVTICQVLVTAEGQLISKANVQVFIWTEKQTKLFLYFCPSFLNGSNHKNNGSLSC